jgi:hypothetical protein
MGMLLTCQPRSRNREYPPGCTLKKIVMTRVKKIYKMCCHFDEQRGETI